MIKYKVIAGIGVDELEEKVLKFLEAGWKLQGGVFFTVVQLPTRSEAYYFCQAMIKEDD